MPGGAQITFHGTRGSTPCSGSQYARYGGNTSCVSLEAGDEIVIFDLGTGLRSYGAQLEAEGSDLGYRAAVLLSHLHWDHVQGLPFFRPLASPDAELDVYGPIQAGGSLGAVFDELMGQPFFPISIHELAGAVRFVGVDADDFPIGGAKVRSRWIRHTSPTLGYRVDLEGVSVAYVSDHGQGCSDDADGYVPPEVLELADGVDLLIHDAQHSCAEYERKRHFGHSTVDYAVDVARQAGARRLALFHHCPSHADAEVDALLLRACELASRTGIGNVFAAADGLTLSL